MSQSLTADVFRAMLEKLCTSSRTASILVDEAGRVVWTNRAAEEEFPSVFVPGRRFQDLLESCTRLELERVEHEALDRLPNSGEIRRSVRPDGTRIIHRYFQLPLDGIRTDLSLHCLTNVSHEKKLEESFLHNLHQLQSMKEIADTLYESLGTQEVIYLILIAVTSQIGFGFNRAFYLEATGNRLRGRIGIGPSNHDEAHQIWTRLATLNFSSLRDVYRDVTRAGGIPDPRTQEIALRMDFPLDVSSAAGDPPPGLVGALKRGKPIRIHSSEAVTDIDRSLFELLGTDSMAVVPLFVRGSFVGLILADNLITRKPIREEDLSLLKTFAGYAGVALERSHLYDELRENVVKLQSANETLKKNQEKLLQAEKLSAIGKLAAYVSHEIRNPLVAIGGLARSLLKDPIQDGETVETLEIIVSEVSRLERFLRETLDFVKPRFTGRACVDLKGIVMDCLATYRKEIEHRAIEIDEAIASPVPRCWIDPDLLRHALCNIIKNAIEAMEGGGILHVRVERGEETALIHVGDTGPGIPEEVRGRIFDPFFTTKPGGTGLGLAIASQNIRGLGGRLDLERSDRFRTVFKLTLPLGEGKQSADAQRNGREGSLGPDPAALSAVPGGVS